MLPGPAPMYLSRKANRPMRSDTQELHRLRTGVTHRTTSASDVTPDVLDEAFALVDESTWRCDTQHADASLEREVQGQLASLAQQSRELTQLLGRLRSP